MEKKIVNLSGKLIDRKTNINQLVSIILSNRKISKQYLESFLNPPLPNKKIAGFDEALVLIKQHLDKNILIYGDYDVDGITSTAIIWQSLYRMTKKLTPYIPHREVDGYGIKADTIKRIEKEKKIIFDLIITVDNGIVAKKEIDKLKDKKIIIIDHHEKGDNLPVADVIIHSTETSGAGLAWLFCKQFDRQADLGLAALGVVADCVPLIGISREIVANGLISLKLNPNPGIKKLMELARCKRDELSTYDLGYILGPRINAIGRLGDPTDALRLICSQTTAQATKYALALDRFNRERQGLQKEHMEEAEKLLNPESPIIVIVSKNFSPGIIGLVAGRLTEKYGLPSVVISQNGEVAKGSCRSIKQLNMIETLREVHDLFVDIGGHPMAAGFSIKDENIEKLKIKLEKIVKNKLKGVDLVPTIEVDADMKLEMLNETTIEALEKLAPFGIGNPQPIFLFRQLKIINKKIMGSNADHLKLKLDDPKTPRKEYMATDAICFKKGDMDGLLEVGDLVDIVATLDKNTWNGLLIPQLVVKEIQKRTTP